MNYPPLNPIEIEEIAEELEHPASGSVILRNGAFLLIKDLREARGEIDRLRSEIERMKV